MQTDRLILASGSPRRATLLDQMGLPFKQITPIVNEDRYCGEDPLDYVRRMSGLKFDNVIKTASLQETDVVIAADTVVVIGDDLLGKPRNQEDCTVMLQKLSGKTHQVLTDITVGRKIGSVRTCCVETIVRFRRLNLHECNAYWRTGEPQDKAGGYGIQGLGAIFVESISGSYSNVVGLPLMETADALATFGISPLQLPG